jgi:hypothetical protein
MDVFAVTALYQAQVSSTVALQPHTQHGIYRFATRHRDIDLLAHLAARPELEHALRATFAARPEPSIRVAYLSRIDVGRDELAGALAQESRSGVLAGLLNAPRSATDINFVVTLEPFVTSLLTKTPTRVLAEAVVVNDALHLDVRIGAASVLATCETLPVSVVEALRQVTQQARTRAAAAAWATAPGMAGALRIDALVMDGLDTTTRIELLHQLFDGRETVPACPLDVAATVLEEVDDLQQEVLGALRAAVASCDNQQPGRQQRILHRIDTYSHTSNAEHRASIAAASIYARNASTFEDLARATDLAFELDHTFVAEALVSNTTWSPDDSTLRKMLAVIPAPALMTHIRAQRDDRFTTCAYLAHTAGMVHLDRWESCEDRSDVQRAVATGLRKQWERNDGFNHSDLLTFAISCVDAAALAELPWAFFCTVATSFDVSADADWVAQAMGYAQTELSTAPAWETFEELGKNFSGSLRELVSVAAGV